MAVRGDVSVDFDKSPRIITVASPAVNIEVQDLVDTLRFLEAEQVNMTYPALVRAAGKDNLGTGYVGITATLQDAQLAFEDRSGPSYTQCSVTGGNLVAMDTNGFNITPIYPTDFTQVVVFQSTSPTLVIASGATGPLTDQDKTDIAVKVWQQPTRVASPTAQDKTDIAIEVWNQPTTSTYQADSFGEFFKVWVFTKLLTVSKFLALK